VLRLPAILPMNYMLFVVAIIAAVVHMPVHVAHGVPRHRFIAAYGVFALAVALLFGVAMSGANHLYDRYAADPQLTSTADLLHDVAAHSAMNLAYMVGGWLIGLAYYRFHPWLATALLPLAAAPMIGAEEATNQIWSQTGYMYTIGGYDGRFGFWTDLALVGA